MILDGRTGPINEKQQSYLATVSQNAGKLVDLLNEIDRFRDDLQIQSGKVDLNKLVSVCMSDVSGQARAGAVMLNKFIPGAPVAVAGDEQQLREALNSLFLKTLRISGPGNGLSVELGVPIAGDDPKAIALAEGLIRGIGFEPVLVGGLAMGKYPNDPVREISFDLNT